MYIDLDIYYDAGNSATPPGTLRQLAASACVCVRSRVAENSAAPADVIVALSRDDHAEVRLAAASNTALPHAVLWELASDPNADVRYCIAENPHTAIEILIWLSADDNPYVALRAEKTIEAVANDGAQHRGGQTMSAKTVERTLRRLLHRKERLNKSDATRLKYLVLEDGYVSRSERRVMVQAIENDLLDDDAFQIFVDILLQKHIGHTNRAIA